MRATHTRILLPAALASVSFGFVLVRVQGRLFVIVQVPAGIGNYPNNVPSSWRQQGSSDRTESLDRGSEVAVRDL